jgi:hypothetical protein
MPATIANPPELSGLESVLGLPREPEENALAGQPDEERADSLPSSDPFLG